MTDDERMMLIIREYRADLGEPTYKWPDMEFEKNAYARWATDELMLFIKLHMDQPIMWSIETFKSMMARYMCRSTNYSEANFIFEIAYEVTCDISDIIEAMI